MGEGIKKLATIQHNLHVPKGNRNEYGKYDYRTVEDIIQAAKPLFKQTGTVLTLTDEIMAMEGRFYLRATARLIDADTGSVIAENCAYAREQDKQSGMQEAQITGAASSYARKYALCGLFAVDGLNDTGDVGEQDPDEQAKGEPAGPPAANAKAPAQKPQQTQKPPQATGEGGRAKKELLREAMRAVGVTTNTIDRAVQTLFPNKRQTWKQVTEADAAYLMNNPGIWNEALNLLYARGIIQ